MYSLANFKIIVVVISLLSLVSCVVHSHPPHRAHKVALKKKQSAKTVVIKVPDQKVFWDGRWYFIHNGHFFKKSRHGFIRISPPVGLTVRVLPRQFVRVKLNGKWRYNYGGVHFRWDAAEKTYIVVKVN